MIQLGLLGNGTSHNRTRLLHDILGKHYDLTIAYTPTDLAQQNAMPISQALQHYQSAGFTGVSITHPYKQPAFAALTQRPALPKAITSINTLVFSDNQWHGFNTDYSGFIHAFRRNFSGIKPNNVLMLGASDMSIAIAAGLAELGAKTLWLYDTDLTLAKALAQRFVNSTLSVRCINTTTAQRTTTLAAIMQNVDGLINATPLGMHQYRQDPFPLSAIGNQTWAFDAVYTPEETDFLAQCRQTGLATLSGFQLFLHQGMDAFTHFTGIEVDANTIEKQYLQTHPIVKHYKKTSKNL